MNKAALFSCYSCCCNKFKPVSFATTFRPYFKGLIVFAILIIASCNRSTKSDGPSSDAFDKVLNQTAQQPLSNAEMVARVDSAFNTLTDPSLEDECKRFLFKNRHFVGSEKSSTIYLDTVIQIIKENEAETRLVGIYSDALLAKGDSLIKYQNYDQAFGYLYDALSNIRTTHDSCLYAHFNIRLADIEYRKGNYLSSIGYNKTILDNFDHCKSKKLIDYHYYQATIDNIALCYDRAGLLDSAVHYYQKALTSIVRYEKLFPDEKTTTEASKGVIYGNMGTTFEKLGKVAEAEELYKKSIAINAKKGYENFDAQITRIKLGNLYLKKSALNEVRNVLNEIHNTGLFSPSIRMKLFRLEADFYNVINEHQRTAESLNAFIMLKDSIGKVEKTILRSNFSQEFKNVEQEKVLSDLKKDAYIKNLYLAIATAFTILLAVIALLIWQNRKRLKKVNIKVSAQNSDMQKALAALEQSQDENTRLLKMVVHDLRSPMAVTISMIDILLDDEALSASSANILNMMKASNANTLEMVTDLLNLNVSKDRMKKEKVEMYDLLQYCVQMLRFKAAEKQQRIILHSHETTLFVSREKIWRAVSNLITNAVKFSPSGSDILVEMHKEKDAVLIKVKDNGIGIPEALKGKLFDIYSDAKRLGTSGEVSFGLGLAISKQIIEAHDGEIWFQTEVHKGSTFFIKLPLN